MQIEEDLHNEFVMKSQRCLGIPSQVIINMKKMTIFVKKSVQR